MQQSRRKLGYLWPLVVVGCGGFDARDYGAPPPAHGAAGIAGFSYDAGAAEGGKISVAPPPAAPNDWGPAEPSGGDSGARDDPGIAPPAHPSTAGDSTAGERGESGDSGAGGAGAEHAGGASGRAAGGQGTTSGAGGRGSGGGGGYGARGGASGHAGGGGSGSGGQAAHGGGGVGTGGGSGNAASGGAGAGGEGGRRALLFSEYVEGSHSYRAVEVRALEAASLEGCDLVLHSNGRTNRTAYALEGKLRAGDTYVVCSSDLKEVLGATCNRTMGQGFNGNDAITLECDGPVIDAIGEVGFDPNPAWSASGVSTLDQTLRRRCSVTQGDATATDAFDPSVEWVSHPLDDFSGLGSPDCD